MGAGGEVMVVENFGARQRGRMELEGEGRDE